MRNGGGACWREYTCFGRNIKLIFWVSMERRNKREKGQHLTTMIRARSRETARKFKSQAASEPKWSRHGIFTHKHRETDNQICGVHPTKGKTRFPPLEWYRKQASEAGHPGSGIPRCGVPSTSGGEGGA